MYNNEVSVLLTLLIHKEDHDSEYCTKTTNNVYTRDYTDTIIITTDRGSLLWDNKGLCLDHFENYEWRNDCMNKDGNKYCNCSSYCRVVSARILLD